MSASAQHSSPMLPTRQQPGLSGRLSVMMFLQYAVWGVWLPYLANYLGAPVEKGGLGFSGAEIGWILGVAASSGAIVAPFLAGQIADRFINAERYLGLLLMAGGALNFALARVQDFATFLLVATAYSVVYMPTLALTNSIALAHLQDPEHRFPRVRLWGTIGWIVASNAFPLIWLQTQLHGTWLPPFVAGTEKPDATALIADALRVSGIAGILYGLFAMVALPATPPRRSAEHPLAFARAFALLKHPGFLVVTLAALPISMIHQVYFIRTGPFLEHIGFSKAHVGPVMSIGQFSEIFFLIILGALLVRLGYRGTLILGGLAYVARFIVFALGTPETREWVAVANTLHGLCYGCFFAGAYLYVERVATDDIRHSAQTVFGIIILGLGPVLAGFYNQYVLDKLQVLTPAGRAVDYPALWWWQTGVAALSTLFLFAAFWPRERVQAALATERAAETLET